MTTNVQNCVCMWNELCEKERERECERDRAYEREIVPK